MRALALCLAILACSGEGQDRCVFDGRYQMGLVDEIGQGCPPIIVFDTVFHGIEDDCSEAGRQLGNQSFLLSCAPGDPVVECTGFIAVDGGCRYNAYIRRIE